MKVQISEQVKKLLPLGIDVSEKQTTSLKGKGELNTFFIINDQSCDCDPYLGHFDVGISNLAKEVLLWPN